MKAILTKLIRLRNSSFEFSKELDNRMLLSFIHTTIISLMRGLKLILLGKMPKGIMLGKGVRFKYAHKIQLGKFIKIGRDVQIQALGNLGIRLGNNVSLGDMSKVVVSTSLNNIGSHITIGNNVGIGEYAYLGGAGGLDIGDDCIVGQYFSCHPENHNFSNEQMLIRKQGVTRKGISIGKDCWIGSKVTILDGVEIGNHCVIAAGSVVTKSFGKHSIIAGVPAKKIKSSINQMGSKVKNHKRA